MIVAGGIMRVFAHELPEADHAIDIYIWPEIWDPILALQPCEIVPIDNLVPISALYIFVEKKRGIRNIFLLQQILETNPRRDESAKFFDTMLGFQYLHDFVPNIRETALQNKTAFHALKN